MREKKRLYVRVDSLIFIVLLIWLPHRLESEQANHSVVARGVAHSNYTITWDYLLFYAERFTAFSRIKTPYLNRIILKCRTVHIGIFEAFPFHILSLSTRHEMKLQYERYTFSASLTAEFSLKIRCQFAFLSLSSFRMFSSLCCFFPFAFHSLFIPLLLRFLKFTACYSQLPWLMLSLGTAKCSMELQLSVRVFAPALVRCIHSNQINWWIFNIAAVRLSQTYLHKHVVFD